MQSTSIKQRIIREKCDLFLRSLDSKEAIPDSASEGLCEGLAFMLFRADLIGQSEIFFNRLHRIANASEDDLKKWARLLKEYKNLFAASAVERGNKLKEKLLACLNNEEKIAKVRSEHATETEKLRKLYLIEAVKKFNTEINPAIKMKEEDLLFVEELYVFINTLLFGHDPQEVELRDNQLNLVPTRDYPKKLDVVMPDKVLCADGKHQPSDVIYEDFIFYFSYRKDELTKVLKEVIKEGDMVRVAGTDHILYLVKKNNILYSIYNGNRETGVADFKTEALLEEDITKCIFTDYDERADSMPIGLKIFRKTESDKQSRPDPAKIIDTIFTARAAQQADAKNSKNVGIEDISWDHFTGLHMAARGADSVTVGELINRGANLDAKRENGLKVLATAVFSDDVNTVKTVVNKLKQLNQSVEQVDAMGYTPFYTAVKRGSLGIVTILLDAKADPNRVNPDEVPYLLHAVRHCPWIVKPLISHGAVVTEDVLVHALQDNYLLKEYPDVALEILFNFSNTENLNKDHIQNNKAVFDMFLLEFQKSNADKKKEMIDKLFYIHDSIFNAIFLPQIEKIAELFINYGSPKYFIFLQKYVDFKSEQFRALGARLLCMAAQQGNTIMYNNLVRAGVSVTEKNNEQLTAADVLQQSSQPKVTPMISTLFLPKAKEVSLVQGTPDLATQDILSLIQSMSR